MKKDIIHPTVDGVKVAVARRQDELGNVLWDVYLINRLKHPIDTVFVTSSGYGVDVDGNKIKTASLRYFFKEVAGEEIVKIEPISPEVFHINNEYWVSYYIGNQIFDKKFIFVPESIREENLIPIAQLGLEGVLHE
ncbi:hypothetical protein [Flectobacillus roseus]|uniref:Uncharacterized protein n=1 Tax=Flectobacillus roseus TaxID=502259 RepID=A0ABT6Y9H2_9BACT|nr:hypothetical protein [Flectobacillus roseus]MDI9860127.1 hypothetical protein [Flectobacillus roseus]NBA77442.1 hypothetical protein [Emticicia sp. ODNR4P]